jgi:deoxyribodipyrimidine photo-lyase
MMPPAVMWFRRDLRLADNPALVAAANGGRPVVPLFVVDPRFAGAGAPRRAYMAATLAALDDSMGRALVYRHGDPVNETVRIALETGADQVYATTDYGPYGARRDAAVARALAAVGVALQLVGSNYAVEPGRVRKLDGTPFSVFTPFWRAWLTHDSGVPLDTPPAVEWLGAPVVACDGPPPRPTVECAFGTIGEIATLHRWAEFTDRALDHYTDQRDTPAIDGTSAMSAALRWGVVHPRRLLADLGTSDSHERFRAELCWREFYADVLHHRPWSAWRNLRSSMEMMVCDDDADARRRFAAWQHGETGYPIIDAGMRQLTATGWMHNRVRMIVASFLVKDLHLPWQWGARHFMEHLVDGDLASNNHGWQWVAGTGTDSTPYLRIFNPELQSRRFDPDGSYIRRWIPALSGLGDSSVHAPTQRRGVVPLGYVAPIVDHAEERAEALRRYAAVSAK